MNVEDAYKLTRLMWNATFKEGFIEEFTVNDNGDRLVDFTLSDYDLNEINVSHTMIS